MDVLECGICHIGYNEDDRRPHTSTCGHEFCSTCLQNLITDGEYVCPKCREKSNANAVEDFPVVFGHIDVIRAFKANTFSLTKGANKVNPCTSNEDVCKIHCEPISDWCASCQLWLCTSCLDSHTSLIGCSTSCSTTAINVMRDNQNEVIDKLLNKFDEDTSCVESKLQYHSDKRKKYLEIVEKHGDEVKRYQRMLSKECNNQHHVQVMYLTSRIEGHSYEKKKHIFYAEKHGEEVNKLQQVLSDGDNHKEQLVISRKYLNETKAPHAVIESIKVVTQRKQTLLNWSAKNIPEDISPKSKQELLKALEKHGSIYAEKVLTDEKKHCKISYHDKNIYVHTFDTTVMDSRKPLMPFDQLEKMIPAEASLIFLELSIGGIWRRKVHFLLDKNLPNIREYFLQILKGEHSQSLKGTALESLDSFLGSSILKSGTLPFSGLKFTPDHNQNSIAKRGDLLVNVRNGFLEQIVFEMSTSAQDYLYCYTVLGSTVEGMEILQKCYKNNYQCGITDCGLIIKCD